MLPVLPITLLHYVGALLWLAWLAGHGLKRSMPLVLLYSALGVVLLSGLLKIMLVGGMRHVPLPIHIKLVVVLLNAGLCVWMGRRYAALSAPMPICVTLTAAVLWALTFGLVVVAGRITLL